MAVQGGSACPVRRVNKMVTTEGLTVAPESTGRCAGTKEEMVSYRNESGALRGVPTRCQSMFSNRSEQLAICTLMARFPGQVEPVRLPSPVGNRPSGAAAPSGPPTGSLQRTGPPCSGMTDS